MTRSDICVILIVYATCILFLVMTLQLQAAAQIYPLCLIAGLALLDTLYLVRCLVRLIQARKQGLPGFVNDFREIFAGFEVRQFMFVVTACIAYMFLLRWLGFYLAGFIYLLCVMFYLKVRPLPAAITTAFLGCLIYAVFTLFLKVPLPKGALFV